MFIVNLKKFDIFYFKGLDSGRFVYLSKGLITREYDGEILKTTDYAKNTEVVKVGKMLTVNFSDLGYIEVQV